MALPISTNKRVSNRKNFLHPNPNRAEYSNLELTDADWQTAVELIQKLIQEYPCFGQKGIYTAQDLILELIREWDWNQVVEDWFDADSIKQNPEYIDVMSFGSIYMNYETIPKRNIIGILENGTSEKTLLFNGHIDVDLVTNMNSWTDVEGWKSGKIYDDRLFGRGATDMLSGLVAQVIVSQFFHKHRDLWSGRIILAAVTDEEVGGNGTLRSLDWLKNANLLDNQVECLIAEPSDETIATSSLGFIHFKLKLEGSPTHMGVSKKKDNALHAWLEIYSRFDNFVFEAAKNCNNEVSRDQLVINIGIINGGQDPAIPIPLLTLEGTIFFPSCISLEQFQISFQSLLKEKASFLSLEWGKFSFSGADFDPKSLYNALVKSSKESNLALSSGLFKSPCDARLLKKWGIPTVIYGPGSLQQAHSTDEFISLTTLRKYINHLIRSCYLYFNE